ncbi:FAD-dependent oxidoreductase [Flavobacteriaceae bacterium F08102]|nr:FAD-dependent oxidoreductase [Flavobacteriaceae bacterium F08102]
MKKVIIIGGGVIGVNTAYYLVKEGCEVTIIDKTAMTGASGGASYVNAGYITPSHIISLAAPGMINKGIKWMFNSASPFYMKPRLDKDFLKWSWYFKKSSTQEKVEKAISVIRDINLHSKELYQEMLDSGDLGSFQWDKRGILMLHRTEKTGASERKIAERAKSEGLAIEMLSRNELRKLEPNVADDVQCAVHYTCDAHTTPTEIMQKMKSFLRQKGVVFKTGEEVVDFNRSGSKIISVTTDKNVYRADEFVLGSGSWSGVLVKKVGLSIPMEGGKGYRIDVHRSTGINYPAILMESKVAVTPMNGFTRFAGTMEFSGLNHAIKKERVTAIAKAAERYYKGLRIHAEEIDDAKCGLRPVSPDGLPYIGRVKNFDNLTLASGHSMMGWSLGPATGKLVSEILCHRSLMMNIDPFNPSRTF